jgi:hypothetical protein
MKFMNLYFYTFYRVYQMLQITSRRNINYRIAILSVVALKVWVILCMLANVAIAFRFHISYTGLAISLTTAIILASSFTFITIYKQDRGYQCLNIFERWPQLRHKVAIWILKVITVLLISDSIYIVDCLEAGIL